MDATTIELKGQLEIEALDITGEDVTLKMSKIKTWIKAYPLKIFPEPDFKKAHEVLKAHGMSLDAISASTMRHVLNGIKAIINNDVSCERKKK